MAAYAALVSLFNTLHHIHTHPHFSTSFDKHQIQSLGAHIDFLLDFVVTFNIDGDLRQGVQELKTQIVYAAHEAEDIIESYVVNQILPADISDVRLHHRCLFGLQKVIEGMDCIKENVVRIKEKIISGGFKYDHNPTNSTTASSSTTEQNRMVGFEDELMQLKDVLIVQKSSRQIISIVGMGGTGKTTLAANAYQDSLIMHHFDLCAWATVSQDYDVKDILLRLLSETGGSFDELGEKLHKKLCGIRYLIVLDDLWSMEVWDRIKFFFPDNVNGSRIVITTRLSNVAAELCSICIRINFLDEEKSWNLFCQKVFRQQDCPVELEGVGKKIVKQCKGLPLSIVVIGGILKKSHRTQEYWLNVSKNINAIFNSTEYGQCLDVLYLSYCHLPAHLKPCFLYMGTFKEDSKIRVSEIIRLWIAEGFLKPNGVQILEEMAEDYLKDLIDRNLILVCGHRLNGKIRCFRIHDLLRELCLKVADKEMFFCVVGMDSIPQGIDRERRLILHHNTPIVHDSQVFEAFQSTTLVRSLICNVKEAPKPPGKCRLLRVYNGANFVRGGGSEFQNVNLRYLCCPFFMFPCSVSLIWNLQTLVVNNLLAGPMAECVIPSLSIYHVSYGGTAPLEIWKMRQLRHLKCSNNVLVDPPESDDKDECVVLDNLRTLTHIRDFRLSEETCKRIQNVKKLRIEYCVDNGLYEGLENLGCLQRLESMRIRFFARVEISKLNKAFPSCLKKLVLEGKFDGNFEELSMIIGSLPQLEVLKLCEEMPMYGLQKWTCVEGGFRRLKYLHIEYSTLESCSLEVEGASHFPVLEKLILINLRNLNEIPSGIADIPTLQLIRLEYCNHSLVISAMKIKEEQESYGNDALQIQVKIYPNWKNGFMERVNVEGLSIDNIHLQYS